MQQIIDLLLATFITSGLALMISEYDGVFNIFVELRKKLEAFNCAVCLSPYIALLPTLLLNLDFVEYLAIIGMSVIIVRRL